MTYEFALNINDETNGLTPTQGLAFGDLGLLAISLDKAISNKDGNKCTLYKIENHGYTPHFTTGSQGTYNNFIEVHKNIYEKGIKNLNKTEANYANTLKKVLPKGTFIEALDTNNKSISKIYPSDIENGVKTFNSITSISGIISEIGSQKLDDTSHIYLH